MKVLYVSLALNEVTSTEKMNQDKKEKANYDIKNSFPFSKFAISITIQDILIIMASDKWHNWMPR